MPTLRSPATPVTPDLDPIVTGADCVESLRDRGHELAKRLAGVDDEPGG